MTTEKTVQQFIDKIESSVANGEFVKLTLGKPANRTQDMKNIYVRFIKLKEASMLSFTYRHTKKDVVNNHPIADGTKLIASVLGNNFLSGELFTTKENIQLKYNKKRVPKLYYHKPTMTSTPSESHDREKKRFIEASKDNVYLRSLGVIDQRGEVIKNMNDKFKQINKYIEIVDGLVKNMDASEGLRVVDMGSGKGYLTFALYDYLNNIEVIKTNITGVETQENLVKSCNNIAKKANFHDLEFVQSNIKDYPVENVDILVALHACNTATDEAIYKGIKAGVSTIIVSPCCYKQVREQMNCQTVLKHIVKFGILCERQAEIVTDGLRALLLEANGYDAKVFEFISSEHTSKNIMIVGTKSKNPAEKKVVMEQIKQIKTQYGLNYHFLEKLLEQE